MFCLFCLINLLSYLIKLSYSFLFTSLVKSIIN
nr:MAG TPA_asm: hypothetical protein [Caudoviricetes sp.]